MGGTRRRYLGPANLLTQEEIQQHLMLIEIIEKQIHRRRTSPERKQELKRHVRNLRSELWLHKQTRKTKAPREEKTYKGAES